MSDERPWFGARVYNVLFKFLGPAQVGPASEETAQADPQFACPVCGHPMSEHTWTEDAGRRRMVCPGPSLPRP